MVQLRVAASIVLVQIALLAQTTLGLPVETVLNSRSLTNDQDSSHSVSTGDGSDHRIVARDPTIGKNLLIGGGALLAGFYAAHKYNQYKNNQASQYNNDLMRRDWNDLDRRSWNGFEERGWNGDDGGLEARGFVGFDELDELD